MLWGKKKVTKKLNIIIFLNTSLWLCIQSDFCLWFIYSIVYIVVLILLGFDEKLSGCVIVVFCVTFLVKKFRFCFARKELKMTFKWLYLENHKKPKSLFTGNVDLRVYLNMHIKNCAFYAIFKIFSNICVRL